ncbi:N-acetylglucosamine-6-phosphate deacetylase [uncultured Victivallis sp.]|uniref:N-acetylglucosamine-6-phosphate deacetylase n=1 Tax=uncultured Victivallis sp. TaxID=354118 RepID=UPI0025FF28B0|nr:N-acetylglucosamine-6-phosphate deacetylase [uncultured Victivallis sp.]
MKNRVRRLFHVDYLITPERRIENGAVLCENDRILAVGGISAFSMESELEVYEFMDAYLTPGFIDTHIHGAGGFDASSVDLSPQPIESMSRLLAERGVTSFFPTVVAAPREVMLTNLRRLAAVMERELPGADAAGINLEGPFINPAKRGAQEEESIVPVDLGFARELIEAGNGLVKVMTFAPELEHATELVELLLEYGVKPSMGHSIANEEQTLRAIDAGASHCTHLFNGMPPLHQRAMGLPGIALTDDRVTVELIIDGRHINPRMVDLARRCKTSSKLVGISDCTMAAGMPNGEYRIGPSMIRVRDGYSQTEQGILAGTTTMLDTGWHSLMNGGHLTELQAASAVTCNPANAFHLDDRGTLMPTHRADLAIYERRTNRPLLTVCNGQIVYRAEEK